MPNLDTRRFFVQGYTVQQIIIIIITLLKAQWIKPSSVALLIEETRNQTESQEIKCWLLMRGENRSTRRKTSQNRVENKQSQSTY